MFSMFSQIKTLGHRSQIFFFISLFFFSNHCFCMEENNCRQIVKYTPQRKFYSKSVPNSKKASTTLSKDSNDKNNVSPLLQLNKLAPGIIALIGRHLPNPFRLKVCKSINKNEYLNVLLNDRIEEIKKNHFIKSKIITKFWPDIHNYLRNPHQFWIPMKQLFQDATFYIHYLKKENISVQGKDGKMVDTCRFGTYKITETPLTPENLKNFDELFCHNYNHNKMNSNKKQVIPFPLKKPYRLTFKGEWINPWKFTQSIKGKNPVNISVIPSPKLITTTNTPTKKTGTGYCSIQ